MSGHTGIITTIKDISNEELLSSSTDGSIKFWNLTTGVCINSLNGDENLNCLEILSLGTAASGGDDFMVNVWDFRKSQHIKKLKGHKGRVNYLKKISKEQLLSGAGDTSIKMWNITMGTCIANFNGHRNEIKCLSMLMSGFFASGSDDGNIKVFLLL